MVIKAVLLICAQSLIQTISTQCIGAPFETLGWEGAIPCGARWATPFAGPLAAAAFPGPFAPGLEYAGYAPCSLAASNGGGFSVSSGSPISPTGVYVNSENVYDGTVYVTGQLPFLSTVELEGALPSVGAGVVAYGCGNGNVAILNEEIAPTNFGPGPYGFGPAGPGIGYGPAGPAIGYGPGGPGFGPGAGLGFGGPCGCGCGAIF